MTGGSVGKRKEGWGAIAQHPSKDIKEVLRKARDAGGWTLWWPEGHGGKLRCDAHGKGGPGCNVDIPKSPRNPSATARQTWRKLQRCPHGHAPS
jgi:hypothetical protein